jgi:hypothetical protein
MHRPLWWSAALALIFLVAGPARASCNQTMISQALIQSAMERHWSVLAHQKSYAWGDTRTYGSISGKRMTLLRSFDTLTGAEKLQVLEPLWLGYADLTPGLVEREFTPAERERVTRTAPLYMGSMSPYEVYSDDGLLISEPYDGCTRHVALTEKERFGIYWNRPRARTQRFPLAAANEQNVKTRFWRTMGYQSAAQYWIGWVPERGYFEVVVPDDPTHWYLEVLRPFWLIAPTSYKYIVYSNDGTRLFEHAVGKVDVPRIYEMSGRRDAPQWRSREH